MLSRSSNTAIMEGDLLSPDGGKPLPLVVGAGISVLLIIIGIAYILLAKKGKKEEDTETEEKEGVTLDKSNSVAGADAEYLASKLTPTSTPWEILFYIATTPENIRLTSNTLKSIDKIRSDKVAKMKAAEEEKKNNSTDFEFDVGEGWASDDDEDEGAKAAKKHEVEVKKQETTLRRTMGKVDPTEMKLEGLDEGVIGQQWVLERLKEKNVWPPRIPPNATGDKYKDEETGKLCLASEHPSIQRNLIMTLGRLNAMVLNTHPDLAKSAAGGNIDQTYFKNTIEFRQRNGLLLEAALRVACRTRSFQLVKTIIQTVSMFKIGVMSATDPRVLTWFQKTMETQYGGPEGVPKLLLKNPSVVSTDGDEVATGDKCEISVDIDRRHAELFTKNKIELCKKQGIPPQLALQTFREVWWVLIRVKRTDDGSGTTAEEEEYDENKLILAFPFVVSQISKKEGKVKVQITAPSKPGKYSYYVSFMSQEFLGSDANAVLKNVEVVDVKTVLRAPKEEKEEEAKNDTSEPKKDK